MSIFVWEDLDHRLVSLKLQALSDEMRGKIQSNQRHIRFENRLNANTGAIPQQILKMEEESTGAWAQKEYEIYCEVWQKQGRSKSADFIRAVWLRAILPLLRVRAAAISNDLKLFGTRTNFPPAHLEAMLKGLRLRMQRLEDRWKRRMEIEALECGHADANAALNPAADSPTGDQVADQKRSLNDKLKTPVIEHGRFPSLSAGNQPAGSSKASSDLEETKLPTSETSETVVAGAASWDRIEILFLSDERVQIRVNGVNTESHNYAELGFEDGRSEKPNQAWALLRILAEHEGTISDGRQAHSPWAKVERRIQEIRKTLHKHFGISSNPISFVAGTGYQTNFKISCKQSFNF